jgi:hypothetical protein
LKQRDGLDRRPTEQYVCVISDFRVVAVNETFFVADVRRFASATEKNNSARPERGRDETRRTKNVKNRRYLVVARRVGKPTFRFFLRL